MRNIALYLLVLALLAPLVALGQLEPIPEDQGATGLALALRKLGAGVTFLETTAHPDDEDNGLLVLLSRGRGVRTALLTVTRGDGGQNMIGPEIFEAIGILRAAELMAMHRVDGVEQYFTRAYEFGYSFSVEETLEKWGKEEILGDIVRIIRTVRPDVVACMFLTGEGGGQHHQTTARLTQEAFRAAADRDRFPEQIKDGLRPWQPLKLYSHQGIGMGSGRGGRDEPDPPATVRIDTGVFDPVLGRSYYQMGQEARANHRCQSMSQLRGLPGERLSRWQPVDSVMTSSDSEKDLFDGVETGLDRFKDFVRGEENAAFFLTGLEELKAQVAAAGVAFDPLEPWRTIPSLRAGLVTVRELREKTAASSLADDARYEIEHRLAVKEGEFRHALTLAHGVGFDPIADRGEVVPGSVFKVGIRVTHQSPEPMEIQRIELGLPDGWSQTLREGDASGRLGVNEKLEASFEVAVSPDAELSRPYWVRNTKVDRFDLIEPEHFGLPFAPPVVKARLTLRSDDVEWTLEEPVQYRYEGPWVGTEKQKRISVLPALSVNLSPGILVYPTGAKRSRTLSVNVLYKGNDPVVGSLRLEVPDGWTVRPGEAPLVFERVNEATNVAFEVAAPEAVRPGTYTIEAVASIGDKKYREGYKTIAYHHIETRYHYRPARAEVQALEIEVEPVTVGYVMGVGDDVPEAIRQLGADVVMLGEQELAEGDLSRFDLIMTGIRAYLNREDLRAYNHRLLSYVEGGGTVIVQYNKFELNDAQWGPYPIQVSRNRVTVEEAPLRILEPSHPVFNFPNEISEADWEGWVQERGTYFIGERDDRYRDLLASEDPWEYNAGEKRGILVEARHGEGRWLYTGLGFYRQLPAGVPDAYKFFANLLSLAKASPE